MIEIDQKKLLSDFNEAKEKVIKINTLIEINKRDLDDITKKLKDEYKLTDISEESFESEKTSRESEIAGLLEQGMILMNSIKEALNELEDIK